MFLAIASLTKDLDIVNRVGSTTSQGDYMICADDNFRKRLLATRANLV
jgi:hypothetical protein